MGKAVRVQKGSRQGLFYTRKRPNDRSRASSRWLRSVGHALLLLCLALLCLGAFLSCPRYLSQISFSRYLCSLPLATPGHSRFADTSSSIPAATTRHHHRPLPSAQLSSHSPCAQGTTGVSCFSLSRGPRMLPPGTVDPSATTPNTSTLPNTPPKNSVLGLGPGTPRTGIEIMGGNASVKCLVFRTSTNRYSPPSPGPACSPTPDI